MSVIYCVRGVITLPPCGTPFFPVVFWLSVKWVGSCGDGTLGRFDRKIRTVTVNPELHRHDAEIRATLLHEMAHAASPTSKGHDLKFFAQLEKLLRNGAPISAGSPEAGCVHTFADIVPTRFPLLRAKMERAEARRARHLLAKIKELNLPVQEVSAVDRFEDAAMELNIKWKVALKLVGIECGLTDETGRPLSRTTSTIIAQGKKAYMRVRRDCLQAERTRQKYLALMAAKAAGASPHVLTEPELRRKV